MIEVEVFCSTAFKNRAILKDNTLCGCYYCCKIYHTSEIIDWCDGNETALCPKCGIDSVVPVPIDEHEAYALILPKAHERWFTVKKKE